jgi:hypothetical protein
MNKIIISSENEFNPIQIYSIISGLTFEQKGIHLKSIELNIEFLKPGLYFVMVDNSHAIKLMIE